MSIPKCQYNPRASGEPQCRQPVVRGSVYCAEHREERLAAVKRMREPIYRPWKGIARGSVLNSNLHGPILGSV